MRRGGCAGACRICPLCRAERGHVGARTSACGEGDMLMGAAAVRGIGRSSGMKEHGRGLNLGSFSGGEECVYEGEAVKLKPFTKCTEEVQKKYEFMMRNVTD